MKNNRHLIVPLSKLLHRPEVHVEQAWRASKTTARVEGRKGDWFLILRLTLRHLNAPEAVVCKVPETCFNNQVVCCLGHTGVVGECTPVFFDLVTDNKKIAIPLFALLL